MSSNLPSISEYEDELDRVRSRQDKAKELYGILKTFIVISSLLIVIESKFISISQVSGDSMNPTLQDGNILLFSKVSDYNKGDIILFYNNNMVLVKRVIAVEGDIVDINSFGRVFINGERLSEPYVSELFKGNCSVEFPLTVGEGEIFVLGDNRRVSVDSRNYDIGCVSEDRVLGVVLTKFW